jgi:hypothetical protein
MYQDGFRYEHREEVRGHIFVMTKKKDTSINATTMTKYDQEL